jgi:hypothetical protein
MTVYLNTGGRNGAPPQPALAAAAVAIEQYKNLCSCQPEDTDTDTCRLCQPEAERTSLRE